MSFKYLAALCTAVALGGAAHAATTTYHISFDIDDIALPVQRLNGNFSVTLDPAFAPYSNDVAPSDANIWTPLIGFDESFSRVDFYPFAGSDPGFLIGWLSGGGDTNNNFGNANYDYRIRFILNPDYSIQSARGGVRYFDGISGYPAVGFDTANGSGRIAAWSITVDSANGAVPEPASWAMLIAGFGLTGAAMRRRRSVAA
jgi:hypothetical protein